MVAYRFLKSKGVCSGLLHALSIQESRDKCLKGGKSPQKDRSGGGVLIIACSDFLGLSEGSRVFMDQKACWVNKGFLSYLHQPGYVRVIGCEGSTNLDCSFYAIYLQGFLGIS